MLPENKNLNRSLSSSWKEEGNTPPGECLLSDVGHESKIRGTLEELVEKEETSALPASVSAWERRTGPDLAKRSPAIFAIKKSHL